MPFFQSTAFWITRSISAVLCRVAPPLAVKWADRLFFRPHPVKRPLSEVPFYNSAEKSFYNYQGRKIALYEWGAGRESIIMVHGWGSRGTRLGTLAQPLSEKGFRVLAFDMPAHGDSEGNTTNLADISEIISHLHKEFAPVHGFIGHSFGGMAIMVAIHRYKLRVRRVALIAAPFSMEYLIESFCEKANLTLQVAHRMASAVFERFDRLKNVKEVDLSPDRFAHSLAIPVLVFHDRDDRDVPYEQGVGYAKRLPDVEFVGTEGLGHRRILKDENVIASLVDFISKR